MNNRKISFESEHIIVNNENNPINFINWNHTSSAILNLIEKKYWNETLKKFKKELDVSQIEFTNDWWKSSLSEAQDEMINSFLKLEDIVKNEFWLNILNWAVPTQNFEPIISKWVDKYEFIDKKLRWISLETRKATNIAWIHFHVDLNKKWEYFNLDPYFNISTELKKIFIKNKSDNRFYKMNNVVWSLWELWLFWNEEILSELIPVNFNILKNNLDLKKILLDNDLNPNFNYNLFTLKKPWEKLTMETRTVDWVWNVDDLIKSTSWIFNLIKNILD